MISMRFDDIVALGVFLLIALLATMAFGIGSARRHRTARQRLDVLGDALQRPDLDAETRRNILRVVTDEHEASRLQFLRRPAFWRGATFAVGWMMFLFCGGMSLAAGMDLIDDSVTDQAIPAALLGLGLLTLPVALREVHRSNSGGKVPSR